MDINEPEIITRCLRGEDAAFHALYKAYGARVRAYFRRSGFTLADSDDLAQETFIRVFKGLETFDMARGTFLQWVAAIARNIARKYWQRRANPENFDPELAAETLAAADNPSQMPETREEINAVRECVDALPPDLARVVRLRYVDAQTTRGIADACNMPEATVRLRLKEAADLLKECLEGKGVLD